MVVRMKITLKNVFVTRYGMPFAVPLEWSVTIVMLMIRRIGKSFWMNQRKIMRRENAFSGRESHSSAADL
jgi:hypothetical protein